MYYINTQRFQLLESALSHMRFYIQNRYDTKTENGWFIVYPLMKSKGYDAFTKVKHIYFVTLAESVFTKLYIKGEFYFSIGNTQYQIRDCYTYRKVWCCNASILNG